MDERPRSMNHMCPVLFRRSLYLFLPPRCRGDHYLDWNYFIIEIIIEIILSSSGRPFLGLKLFFSSDPDLNEGCKILSGQSSWSYFKMGFTDFFYWLIYHKFVPHIWIFKTNLWHSLPNLPQFQGFDVHDDDNDSVEAPVSVMGTVRNCFGRIEKEVVPSTSANWRHNAE